VTVDRLMNASVESVKSALLRSGMARRASLALRGRLL
jgi:hypothetical protein